MARQVVTLGELTGQIERLEIRCTRCDRAGLVKLAKLIAEHGAAIGMPDLAVIMASERPKVRTTDVAERCSVMFPQLLDR